MSVLLRQTHISDRRHVLYQFVILKDNMKLSRVCIDKGLHCKLDQGEREWLTSHSGGIRRRRSRVTEHDSQEVSRNMAGRRPQWEQ